MKKTIKKAALLLGLALTCMAFTACGGQSAAPKETAPATALTNTDGVVLLDNSAVNVNDADAQAKLEQYMAANSFAATAAAMSSDYYTANIFAKGNALVFEMDVNADLTDAQKQVLGNTVEAMKMNVTHTLAKGRSDTGVSNLVAVIVFVDKNGEVITSTVCDQAEESPATTAPVTEQPTSEAAQDEAGGNESEYSEEFE